MPGILLRPVKKEKLSLDDTDNESMSQFTDDEIQEQELTEENGENQSPEMRWIYAQRNLLTTYRNIHSDLECLEGEIEDAQIMLSEWRNRRQTVLANIYNDNNDQSNEEDAASTSQYH